VYVYSSSTAMYDVYDMEPAAGSVLERGSNVTVYVSLGDAQDAWSEWIDGNVPEYISGDYWWSDEYYKYYEYEEIEYRTVCRYRTKLMTVD
ncbi:MAG: PASTA domain-containing protein, partial [Clostridia bacterium]|nr:PASTA domain-containing protein [Clostridia bacterium]